MCEDFIPDPLPCDYRVIFKLRTEKISGITEEFRVLH